MTPFFHNCLFHFVYFYVNSFQDKTVEKNKFYFRAPEELNLFNIKNNVS
jgi:hypothetical protein